MRHDASSTHNRSLTLALLCLLACDKPEAQKPHAAPSAAATHATANADAAAAQPTRAQPGAIANRELEALLARWTEAQNRGDFGAYEQLYAQRFLGIKRAGERTSSFTREPWLEDRKRMFQKPIQVQALEPELRASSDSAELSFTQRWASGTFADVGKKRLLVVREAGTLKIAHEEMLSSALMSGDAARAVVDFHFTLALESGLYMPLPEVRAPATHGAIRAEVEADHDAAGNVFTSSASVEDSALAPAALAWKGNKVRLDDGCVAEVAGFVLLSRVEPHFGTVQQWQGTGDAEGKPALAPAQIAEAAFNLTTPVVAARLTGCPRGTFAQREQTAVPMRATFVEDPTLVPKARAAFAKLKSVQTLQARHLREAEDKSGLWWEPSLKLQSFRHPLSGQTLLSASADNGGICADFAASEWALFELRGGKLVHLYSGAPPRAIEQVLDVDGDGRLELIVIQQSLDSDRALVSPDPTGPQTELRHSYQDCPC